VQTHDLTGAIEEILPPCEVGLVRPKAGSHEEKKRPEKKGAGAKPVFRKRRREGETL
jgi:hypothetical protein